MTLSSRTFFRKVGIIEECLKGGMDTLSRTISGRNATVNIHDGYCTDSVQTERTVSRIVSEYYKRRMREKRMSNNWNAAKLDADESGRI